MKHCLSIFAVLVILPRLAWAAVDSVDGLKKAIRELGPGVTIQVSDGTYEFSGALTIEGKHGREDAPIVLRADHRGKAIVGGAAGFVIRDCEHLVLEGFAFAHDADQQAVRLENCRQVRVSRNTFRLSERAKPRHWEHWVTIEGARSGENRVDHNRFERKVNRGSHVFVRGDDQALVCSQKDRVDHNHFRDVIFANKENGHETIRTGGNDLGASGKSSFTVIEDNLLEHCSGEDEIMSLKSSDNIVRRNTLLNCRGAICLRLGNRNVVSGNFILATEGGPGCGGVKLYGFEHRVFNNSFSGLTGSKHEAPLALLPGMLDTPSTENIGKKYDDKTAAAPTRCWIAFNTWVDCAPLQFGLAKEVKDVKFAPNACTFVNNLVVRTKPRPAALVNFGIVRDLNAHGNLACSVDAPSTDPWAQWFRWEGPDRCGSVSRSGLWRLTKSSPAVNTAVEVPIKRTDAVFGRARNGQLDIGAEELSKQPEVFRPLTAEAVGPDAP